VPVTVKVPPPVNVPPLGLKPSESVASPAYDRSWLPASSYTVTRTARIECPAWVIAGWSVNRRKRPEPGGGGGGGAPQVTTKAPRPVPSAGTFTVTGFAPVTVHMLGTSASPTMWSPAVIPLMVMLCVAPIDPAEWPSTLTV